MCIASLVSLSWVVHVRSNVCKQDLYRSSHVEHCGSWYDILLDIIRSHHWEIEIIRFPLLIVSIVWVLTYLSEMKQYYKIRNCFQFEIRCLNYCYWPDHNKTWSRKYNKLVYIQPMTYNFRGKLIHVTVECIQILTSKIVPTLYIQYLQYHKVISVFSVWMRGIKDYGCGGIRYLLYVYFTATVLCTRNDNFC